MRQVLLSNQPNCVLAQGQDKQPQKTSKRMAIIMPSTPFSYPVFFEIEGDGGPFSIDPDERDPDEMSEQEFRRRYLGR